MEAHRSSSLFLFRRRYHILPGLTRSLLERCLRAAPKLIRTLHARRLGGYPRFSLEHLAQKGDFDTIIHALEHPYWSDQALRDWLDYQGPVPYQETALHRLLKYQPPLHAVAQLMATLRQLNQQDGLVRSLMVGSHQHDHVKISSSSSHAFFCLEEWRDRLGRNPLHMAAASACDVDVIALLLDGETGSMPAVWKDKLGRYPLHWICCHGGRQQSRKKLHSQLAVENVRRVILRLLSVFPQALVMVDNTGCTPLDLARASGADAAIVQMLEDATRMYQDSKRREEDNMWLDLTESTVEISHSMDDWFDDDDVSSLDSTERREWSSSSSGVSI